MTIKKYASLHNIKFGKSMSRSNYYKKIKNIGITRKRARNKIIKNKRNLEKQKKNLNNKIIELEKNKREIISIDESSFHINNYCNYGYNYSSKKVDFIKNNTKRDRYSLLCAHNKSKIVDYIFVKGSIKKNIFIKFIENIKKKHKRSILFMDNASIHHSKEVKSFAKKNNCILYNIPYNPESNPIEHLFNKIKIKILSKNNNNYKQLLNSIKNILKNIKKEELKNYFIKSFNSLKRVINN